MSLAKENIIQDKSSLSSKEKVSYGLGNLASNLLITTANAFVTYFYTEQVGLAAATAGSILFFSRIFDGLTDLGMGVIVDKTDSKLGKARPWLKWLAIPYGLALILLFITPNFGETGNVAYAFLTYIFAVGIIYTGISVPYNAMIGTMTNDSVDRGHLSTFRTAFGYSGAWLVNVITLPIVAFFGGGNRGWLLMAIVYAIISSILWYITFNNTKEHVTTKDDTTEKVKSVPIMKGLKTLFKNKYWLMIISVMFISFINSGIGGVNPYYAQYILGNALYVGAMGTAQFAPIILMMFVIGPMMKFVSKRNLIIVGGVVGIIGRLMILVNPESLTLVLTGVVIGSIGSAPMLAASFAMLGDTVDYGQWKSGVRTEGLAYSAATFSEKVGSAMGGIILGVLMGIAGYVGGQATQTPEALNAIVNVFVYVPVIANIIAIIVMFFYDLDKKHNRIVKELQN